MMDRIQNANPAAIRLNQGEEGTPTVTKAKQTKEKTRRIRVIMVLPLDYWMQEDRQEFLFAG